MAAIAVISDIHGNLPALTAALDYLDKQNPDLWICLGDIVGYGPNPSECIEVIRERNIPTVMGNHDAGVSGKLSTKFFKNPNRALIEITQNLLKEDQIQWLRNLPYIIENKDLDFIVAHANPVSPEKWEYIDSAIKARNILKNLNFSLCLIGHTHIPAIIPDQIGVNGFVKGNKYIINPGSIGQSRDGDFRASCCLINTEETSVKVKRLEYNIEKVLYDLTELGFSRKEAHHLMRY